MRYSLLTGLSLLTLVGCSVTPTEPGTEEGTAVTAASSASAAASAAANAAAEDTAAEDTAAGEQLPLDTPAQQTAEQACPYLDTAWLADTNGQKVTHQGIDERFDPPACIFWSYPEAPQATVMVRKLGTVQEARAAVDWAAPIEQTEPVDDQGWQGGRGVLGPEMAVYAVQKGPTAVLVWTNQEQTLKAQLIAQEAIRALGL